MFAVLQINLELVG